MISLNKLLQWLKKEGCQPCLSLRGNLWRAHVNGAGNFWYDANTPFKAMRMAVKDWKEAGCPMDGYADPGTNVRILIT